MIFYFFGFFCKYLLKFFLNSLQVGKISQQKDVFFFTFFNAFLSNIDI